MPSFPPCSSANLPMPAPSSTIRSPSTSPNSCRTCNTTTEQSGCDQTNLRLSATVQRWSRKWQHRTSDGPVDPRPCAHLGALLLINDASLGVQHHRLNGGLEGMSKSGLRLPCCMTCTNFTFAILPQVHRPLRSALSSTASEQSVPEESSP